MLEQQVKVLLCNCCLHLRNGEVQAVVEVSEPEEETNRSLEQRISVTATKRCGWRTGIGSVTYSWSNTVKGLAPTELLKLILRQISW